MVNNKTIEKNKIHIGEKYNRLTIIDIDYNKTYESNRTIFKCKCECGNFKSVDLYKLKSGNTKSCGCLNREKTIEYNKKYKIKSNNYDIDNDNNIVRIYSNTNKEDYFIIDLDDFEKVKCYCWNKTISGYWIAPVKGTNKTIKIHNLILTKINNNNEVDHINRNKSDNRKCNLRELTHRNNSLNRGMLSNNTSGVKGVSYIKRDKVWVAYIKINGKQILLGRFKDKEDAIKIRKEAEIKYGFDKYEINQ